MPPPGSTPVLVGVGEVCNRSQDVKDAIEPADLMLQAIQKALQDTSQSSEAVLQHVDSISVVPPWTWPYPDLPGLLADKLDARPSHLHIGEHGGNQPALQCDEAARKISLGQTKVAIVTGGEALASLGACQKAGQMPPKGWTKPDLSKSPIDPSDMSSRPQNLGTRHSMGLPIHVYPMYENALRHHGGQSPRDNSAESANLYASFDQIASQREYSWRSGAQPRDADAIGTVSGKNRMICTPYPLLMNAFNTVNLAAACILTSVDFARTLGVPEEKWVYILGGAGTDDSHSFWERQNYYSSPALGRSIDAAIDISVLTREEIDCFDIYSCFPIVPKLACEHLGINVTNPEKPITVLGGLTSFGGAGNNYSMHAITEMVRQIRRQDIQKGLVLANGGVLTHQHALCLSSHPRKDESRYPSRNPLPPHTEPLSSVKVVEQASGDAEIETYTVEFHRKGDPKLAHVIGRLRESGYRFVANHDDEGTLRRLADTTVESVGLRGSVRVADDGRNLFSLEKEARL